MGHGRLYRFECRACDAEYIAVGAEDDAEAVAMATANDWAGEDDLWYRPDCTWDGDEGAAAPGGVRTDGVREETEMEYELLVETVARAIRGSDRVPFPTALGDTEARVAIEVIGGSISRDFRQIAQMTHQAFHHADDSITWRECPVASCVRARGAITALGLEP